MSKKTHTSNTMKNKQILDLLRDLSEFVQKEPNLNDETLYYAIRRTITRCERVRDKLMEEIKYHEDTKVYQDALRDVKLKHAKKVDGNPVIENGQYVFESRISEDIKKLEEEFKDVISHNDAVEARFKLRLEEENKEFQVFLVKKEKLKNIPKNYNFSLIHDIIYENIEA